MTKFKIYLLFLFFIGLNLHVYSQNPLTVNLNGTWKIGEGRNYIKEVDVPGIATDPGTINKEKLWYKKTLVLPKGKWEYATLELKGARFSPEVYINGNLLSKKNGGMASTFHLLNDKSVKPGKTITLEIALSPLSDISPEDASYIPKADQWRSNISSCLWDDVILHLHGDNRISKIIPYSDIQKKEIQIKYNVENISNTKVQTGVCLLEIHSDNGVKLFSQKTDYKIGENSLIFSYNNILDEWSPENPKLYSLSLSLLSGEKLIDKSTSNFGIKDFQIKEKQFYLNGNPCKLRGGTIVWHRWVRSDEGRTLGYDSSWFTDNIILRLKEHGANYLRFHLGVPPERLLDLCDKYGLLVQYEWSFFHGMPATRESCLEQYEQWLDLAMKHPSIAIYHPYNETEGDQLETVWSALNELTPKYPSLVMSERDVIHIHKYWWSLFENLGLYYDSYNQFDKAIMVDEFGGNYLDENGEMGGYKSIAESYLRFLGRNHTKQMRLKHLALSNGKIAEYWRRIGAAGVSPFCIASSWEDGNTWFMGKLKEGNPKTVWNALTSLWSPISVSIDIWDKNYTPNEKITLPIHLFNDTDQPYTIETKVTIEDKFGKIYSEKQFSKLTTPFSKEVESININLPIKNGDYTIKASVLNRPENVKYPINSEWDIRVFEATKSDVIDNIKVYIPDYEDELLSFATNNKVKLSSSKGSGIDLMLLSHKTWLRIEKADTSVINNIHKAIESGTSVIMLDVGNRLLGQGYPPNNKDLGPLQGVAKVTDPKIYNYDLFGGIVLTFKEAAEPETHIFPDQSTDYLWRNLPKDYSGMWNGLRGCLTVPAADMEISGLNQVAFLEQWKVRGADIEKIKSGSYFAYELQGFYEFSNNPSDKELEKKLREKVIFLVEDAPALASSINPNSPIQKVDLSQKYKQAEKGIAKDLLVLVNAGKNLTRTPVMMIDFGEEKGKLIVSQFLTAGRLSKHIADNSSWAVKYDETAVQILLNMMELATKKQ